ncbi:hydrogenase maturation carbamoyltransferase HypF [Cricetibacter osteomyelitidis]|uniref:Carbamoyltransferase HypF n=1 Tax=Cricetibacter osteomyelitidis TaxID=1521931 RepID=A0A4V2T265_9PAST|nr:carbamoyltransferase HypF [Cricetibacter osteomyelitidis]TCP96233.1 hydrogenase maturation carbamoyltransferase HypF [Cricetibacter osteomyelitidis]
MHGIELRIKGKVQGVGFRPFVWLLANEYQLKGDVNNDGEGVLIRFFEPNFTALQGFLTDLYAKLPPLAEITALSQREMQWQNLSNSNEFVIRESEGGAMDTQILPDAATCPECLAELFDRNNRRYHYPFTNCTHCGPRFTIIKAIPYDRKNTSMANFPFCPECEREYKNPANRRFHAQPNACPVCGPHIWLQDNQHILAERENALKQTTLLLVKGNIIAVKGLGGFHLACDATNAEAVNRLRQRKHRPSKPLAIMVPSTDFLQNLSDEECKLLQSAAAPIVLLKKHKVPHIVQEIAPNLLEIGVMLPSNPLQHLLLREINRPLVMTSANPSGQPPVLDNQSAVQFLQNLADFYLCHNRDILQRADDSLVRIAFDGIETLRRARGYVPDELVLDLDNTRHILAMGSDLKNTFCLLKGNKAIVSQHIGDTANELVQTQLVNNTTLFRQIYQFAPELIAVDAHRGYFSSHIGRQMAQEQQLPCVTVLHHHAHIVSVMAEHHYHKPAIGIALDGIGMGENQQLWGGECLLVDEKNCVHLGGLPAVALPGGDLAATQPWRNLLAHLKQFTLNWQQIMTTCCPQQNWQLLSRAIEQGINSPRISSAGRLFDAVAYSLGIAPDSLSWEGEAACHLEALAWQSQYINFAESAVKNQQISVKMPLLDNILDLATFWQSWFAYEAEPADKALAFHMALAQGFAELARRQGGRHHCDTIVLSGGVMHNQLLRRLLKAELAEFNVLSGHQYPMNDGGLALGQAVIAAYNTES